MLQREMRRLVAFALPFVGFWSGVIHPGAAGQEPAALDLAHCDLEVAETESVSRIPLADGGEISVSTREHRLVLFHLTGSCRGMGSLPLHPSGFGVHYMGEESLAFSAALAVGVRGTADGRRPYEAWYRDPKHQTNLVFRTAGEPLSLWFAVEIPESVATVRVRVPTLLRGQVPVDDPRGVKPASLFHRME